MRGASAVASGASRQARAHASKMATAGHENRPSGGEELAGAPVRGVDLGIRMASMSRSLMCAAALFSSAAAPLVFASGCVPKEQYNLAVRDASQAKDALAKRNEQCDERLKSDEVSLSTTGKALQEREQQLAEAGVAAHNLQAKLDEATAMSQELRSELSRLGKNVDQLLSEKGALTQSVTDMKARLESLRRAEQAAEARTAVTQRMTLQFKPLMDAGFLAVALRDNRVTITIPSEKLFEAPKTELTKTGEAVVKQVAIVLQTYRDRRFEVRAHTDSTPFKSARFASNWEFSGARAVEVVRRLVANGLRAEALSGAAYAESDPLAPNDTAPNKTKNRRVEIVVAPKVEELIAPAPAPAAGK